MSSPEQSIQLDDDVAGAAAGELLGVATRVVEMKKRFIEAAEAFEADARLDGDVMPASKATVDFFKKAATEAGSNLVDSSDKLEQIGNAINGRIAEGQFEQAQTVSEVGAVDSGGTPR